MNRSRMRRQLYRGGGIASLSRQNYGIGSWVKERIRKLIPNELADIAVKAAPFVAPFNPGIAGLMRGIGRFDQRGSMSDALKQGLLTYGGGKLAGYLGGAEGAGELWGPQSYSKAGFGKGPIGRTWGKMMPGGETKPYDYEAGEHWTDTSSKIGKTGGEKGVGFIKGITEETIGKVPLLKDLPPIVQQKIISRYSY